MSANWVINEKKLRWWGKEHDWYSLNDIAGGLGVATSTLSRVVNAKTQPGHELLASVQLVFGDEGFRDIFTAQELAS